VIVGSVLLVVIAGVLLALGLVQLDPPLLYSSIGVSALAALTLVLGVRRMAAVRAGRGVIAVRPRGATIAAERPVRATGRATPRPIGRATVGSPVPFAALDEFTTETVPIDEPAEQPLPAEDAARLGTLDTRVLVVDGRPRFHLADCAFLVGREPEPMPVSEAIEFGFTACGLCRPATALLPDPPGDGVASSDTPVSDTP
jgi:hypothetical protein